MEKLVKNRDYWQGRRVLVTGHTGFKGGWLCLWLQQLGANVTGYALAPSCDEAMFNTANVASGMSSHIGDIRDLDELSGVMRNCQPEVVIHMAAQALVRDSYENPVDTYTTNVIGTVNLLEAVRTVSSVRVVLNVTTDKCYENKEWVRGYRESDRLGGADPYSNSKACSELVSSSYRESFLKESGVALATARAGNVIGGGDWAKGRIVPDAIRAFASGKSLVVRNPAATRPWQHVLEPVSGYLDLCEQLARNPEEFSEAWNFGPSLSDCKPVSALVDLLKDLWGEGADWTVGNGTHPHETNTLKLDCTKANEMLGWFPVWGVERAVAETVQWYRYWHQQWDVRESSLSQIALYESLGAGQ